MVMGYRGGSSSSSGTALATPNTLVKRDGNAKFDAGGMTCATAVTVGTPTGGFGDIDYGQGWDYYNSGNTYDIQVWAFKNVGASRVYSTGYTSASVTDNGNSDSNYIVNWSWNAVAGAAGYLVVKDGWMYQEVTS